MIRLLPLLALALLAACKEDSPLPIPIALTEEAVGHYCQMDLLEHPGPKAQVHLDGLADPLFFSQVRDAIAYQRMPEQGAFIRTIYVNDMGAAPSWDDPGATNWIPATEALYVVGSGLVGGMGAPELVPFSDAGLAAAFATANGGTVMTLDAIPDDAVLAPVALDDDISPDNYRQRLDALSQEGNG